MSNPIVLTVPITTASNGSATATTPHVNGRILHYRYVPHASTPIDTGGDLDIVGAKTGIVIANHDNIGTSAFIKSPRQPTHDETGAASLYAAGGEPVEDYMWVNESLTVTIANGGDTKSGTFYITVG